MDIPTEILSKINIFLTSYRKVKGLHKKDKKKKKENNNSIKPYIKMILFNKLLIEKEERI